MGNRLIHAEADVLAWAEQPPEVRVLAAMCLMARGDRVTAFRFEAKDGQGVYRQAHHLNLTTDTLSPLPAQHTAAKSSFPEQPWERATQTGQRLYYPIHHADGHPASLIVIEKVGQTLADGRFRHEDGIITANASFLSQERSLDAGLRMADVLIETYQPFTVYSDTHRNRAERQACTSHMQDMHHRQAHYDTLSPLLLEYVGAVNPHMHAHFTNQPEITRLILETVAKDTSKGFRHVDIRPDEIDFLTSLTYLHDAGKGHTPPESVKWPPDPDIAKAHYARGKLHDFRSYVMLCTPGCEQDALIAADHHGYGRKPFQGIPSGQRSSVSRFLEVADKLDAITGDRGEYGGRQSVGNAMAILAGQSLLPQNLLDPQIIRLLLKTDFMDVFAEKFARRHTSDLNDLDNLSWDGTLFYKAERPALAAIGITSDSTLEDLRTTFLEHVPDQPLDITKGVATYLSATESLKR